MADAAPILDRRSLGLKFLLVCALAVLMSIPAFFVWGLVEERAGRARGVVAEVGATNGGEQTIVGPILVAPYTAVNTVYDSENRPTRQVQNGWYAVFARTGSADATIAANELRHGSLFKVRTYAATTAFAATFDLSGEPSAAPANAEIDWSRAAILLGVSDPRGIEADAAIAVDGHGEIPFEPGSAYGAVFPNFAAAAVIYDNGLTPPGAMQWLAADVSGFAKPGAQFSLTSTVRVRGVESFSLNACARTTDLRMHGDWKHVAHHGAFQRKDADEPAPPEAAGAAGPDLFDAAWAVPYVRRNLADAGPTGDLAGLGALSVQTRFLDPLNPYQTITRSLKYALLFVGVVFLAYFLFEATGDRRVHPAQYVLVGLAQLIFYLLLLSIAERIGFDFAFLVAAAATVLLLGCYAGAVFKSNARAAAAIAAFSLLYALIYVLMTLEDYALLMGAVASFAAIAGVMYFMRNVDWYGLASAARERGAPPPA
jgi:inner membrane protein